MGSFSEEVSWAFVTGKVAEAHYVIDVFPCANYVHIEVLICVCGQWDNDDLNMRLHERM